MNTLSKNLRYLMEKNNINKNQLAKILAIPSMSIGRWVNGKVADPSLPKIINLSNFFEVNIDDLITKNLEAQDQLKNILTKYVHVPYFEWGEDLTLENIKFIKTIAIPNIFSINENNIYSVEHSKEYYGIYPQNSILIFTNDVDKEAKPNDVLLVKNQLINKMLFIQYKGNNEYRSVLTYEMVDIKRYVIQGTLINIILHKVFLNSLR